MLRRSMTVLALAGLICPGCFESSTSQASFESSSKSSSSGGGDSSFAFRRDVQEFTAAYAPTGGDVRSFERDLGAIAEMHGVIDWERTDDAYVAIGRGLAQAGVERERAEAFGRALSCASDATLARIVWGYTEVAVR